MITATLAKKFLIHLYPEYSSVLSELILIYRKINIGERYCYDIKYEGNNIPLIGFRIDLDKPDININENILQILNYGFIRRGNEPISYSLIEDYIRQNRDQLIEQIQLIKKINALDGPQRFTP